MCPGFQISASIRTKFRDMNKLLSIKQTVHWQYFLWMIQWNGTLCLNPAVSSIIKVFYCNIQYLWLNKQQGHLTVSSFLTQTSRFYRNVSNTLSFSSLLLWMQTINWKRIRNSCRLSKWFSMFSGFHDRMLQQNFRDRLSCLVYLFGIAYLDCILMKSH